MRFVMELKLLMDGKISVVSLSGRIEVEKAQHFKKACLQNFKDKNIVFCMKSLNFVGSSGIQSFFSILNELNTSKKMNVKITGLSPDFQRVLQFSDCSTLEVHEDIDKAVKSF
jgi:anti-anti-sigma factor